MLPGRVVVNTDQWIGAWLCSLWWGSCGIWTLLSRRACEIWGGTAGPDRHALDRGRDGGNRVAGSKEALALLLPSPYCCLASPRLPWGLGYCFPCGTGTSTTMKGHRLSASAGLSLRANLKPLQTPFDWAEPVAQRGTDMELRPTGRHFPIASCRLLRDPFSVGWGQLDHFPSGSMGGASSAKLHIA